MVPTAQTKDDLPTEVQRILTVLRRHNGHRSRSARELGINRTTLWRKIKRHGLDMYLSSLQENKRIMHKNMLNY
jgi:transcriptional regulator of acetoin/glycerol metabolism